MTREAKVQRQTKETELDLTLHLDGQGHIQLQLGLGALEHFVTALAFYAGFDLTIVGHGDLGVEAHHLVEDTGIVLGQAVHEAMGPNPIMARFGQRLLPMDEALVLVSLDLGGRTGCYFHGAWPSGGVGVVSDESWREFFRGFCRGARATLHLHALAGEGPHHTYEAAFKGLGLALREALAPRSGQQVPSTKGHL